MFKRIRGAGTPAALAVAAALSIHSAAAAQEVVESSISMSGSESALTLELSDGQIVQITLSDGLVLIGGAEVGSYAEGGALERGWREFLRDGSFDLDGAWAEFANLDLSEGAEAGSLDGIRSVLQPLIVVGAPVITPADVPAAALAPAQEAEAPAEVPALAPLTIESVEGGLVVQVPEIERLSRTLGRVGLAPGFSRMLNGDLKTPLKIVVEADEYVLPEGVTLDQSLILVETDAIIAGSVTGNLVAAESDVVLEPSAIIGGNVVSIESQIENLGATINGLVRELEGGAPVIVAPRAPRIRLARGPRSPFGSVARGMGSLLQTAATFLLMCFLGFLTVYFFRDNLEVVSDTVSYSFGRAFLTGLLAEMLAAPILVIMVVLVLTWIAIPFYVLGIAVAALLGYLSVAHAAGENLTRRRYPTWAGRLRRSNSYYYILNGLAVLLGLFALASLAEMGQFILGWAHGLLIAAAGILTWVATTAGFGAVLLSKGGTQRRFARPAEVPALSDSLRGVRARRPAARARRRSQAERPSDREGEGL